VIAGYFGSGAAGHPNKGYRINAPYGQGSYTGENFPGSAQTQVTGIDDKGNTSGFWVSGNGTSHGFVQWNGVFASYNDPTTPRMAGSVNQLLGINDNGVAVGFYNDAAGNSHAYQVQQASGVVTAIKIPGAVPDVVAEAITRTVRQFGTRGCAVWMAQEFGDHPEAAAERMRWVRQLITQIPALP